MYTTLFLYDANDFHEVEQKKQQQKDKLFFLPTRYKVFIWVEDPVQPSRLGSYTLAQEAEGSNPTASEQVWFLLVPIEQLCNPGA